MVSSRLDEKDIFYFMKPGWMEAQLKQQQNFKKEIKNTPLFQSSSRTSPFLPSPKTDSVKTRKIYINKLN